MELLGVNISALTPKQIIDLISEYVDSNEMHHIVTINPEYIVEAQENTTFKNVLNSAEIKTIDGIGIILGLEYKKSKGEKKESLLLGLLRFFALYLTYFVFHKQTTLTRFSGVDLIWLLVQQDFMCGRKVYLLGGRDQVSSLAAKRLGYYNDSILFRSSNGLNNVRDPDPNEEKKLIEDINSFNPDILLVAYGHPWQDLWIAQNKTKLATRVAIGVGGSFDYISQRVPRAPGWMQRIGLEWCFRLFSQPARFNRIVRATYVFSKIVINK